MAGLKAVVASRYLLAIALVVFFYVEVSTSSRSNPPCW